MGETKTGRPGGRRYTAAEREAVLRDAEALGQSVAARKHGVPKTTVSGWLRKARAATTAVPQGSTGRALEDGASSRVASPSEGEVEATRPHRGSARRYTPSEKARAVELASSVGVSAASKELGISRYSLYDWQRKVAAAARGQGESPTSGPSPRAIEMQRDREILGEWKKHAGLGPSQVRNQLRRRGVKVSVATVRRVMEQAGYRPPKVKREPHDERYESVRPNHRWHLDFVHRYVQRAQTWTLILIDDYSRYVVGHAVDDRERSGTVIETFEQAVARHGKPERVMSDRGSAFWSWRGVGRFTALLTEMEIEQEAVEHKEHNGKVEVFNGNLHKELFDRHRFWDVSEMKRRLQTHLHWYNHGRTHHALGGLLVPADRYYAESRVMRSLAPPDACRRGGAGSTLRIINGPSGRRSARHGVGSDHAARWGA